MNEYFKTILKELHYKKEMMKFLRANIRQIKFPRIIVLQSFNRCNNACVMCPYPYTIAKEKETRLSEEIFRSILEQTQGQDDFESLIFAFQNEPLLDDRVFEWAKIYKSMFSDKRLELVTNGSLLNQKTAERIYKYFDYVHVSLNAFTADTHRKLTNRNYFNEISQNLHEIGKIKEWKEKTVIRFISQQMNIKEKRKFYRYWRKKGFMVFGFDVNDRLRGVRSFDKIKVQGGIYRKIKMKILKHFGLLILPTCPIPFLCFYIKANGGAVQCFNDWSNEHILGNVNNEKIIDIYNSKALVDIRRKLLENKLDDNAICAKCDLYKEGIWLTV